MSIFILVVNEGKLSVPGDNQRCSNCGVNTRHGPFKTYAKHHCSKLGHAVVMNIWNIDAWPRQKSLPRQSHVISLYFQIKYLICLIVLYCYRRSLPLWYPLSNLKEITSLSPLETFLKANSTKTCWYWKAVPAVTNKTRFWIFISELSTKNFYWYLS